MCTCAVCVHVYMYMNMYNVHVCFSLFPLLLSLAAGATSRRGQPGGEDPLPQREGDSDRGREESSWRQRGGVLCQIQELVSGKTNIILYEDVQEKYCIRYTLYINHAVWLFFTSLSSFLLPLLPLLPLLSFLSLLPAPTCMLSGRHSTN